MDDDIHLVRHARAGARELVTVAREGDTSGVFDVLRKLAGDDGIAGPDTRLIVGQLVSASAQMMLLRVGDQPADITYAVDLRDDDESKLQIDELEPPLRATVRALLAELNGRPDEAGFQLDMALCEQSVPTTLDVVVHSLLWTIGLLEWCEAERQPPPAWLAVDSSYN